MPLIGRTYYDDFENLNWDKVMGIKFKEKDVTISKERYDDLCDKENKLEALEAGGVDNWEWYGESLQEYWKEKEEE